MKDMEPTNLCETCRNELECLEKGVFERETCDEYQPLPIGELLARDEFVRAVMVGACPKCGSQDAYGCENNPLLQDGTMGHCLDCETYWCLECDYVFETIEEGMQCPHWAICTQCSDENGYLDPIEFEERFCPTCQYYDDGCQLEDPFDCEKQRHYVCPYEGDVSECPEIEEFLQEQT